MLNILSSFNKKTGLVFLLFISFNLLASFGQVRIAVSKTSDHYEKWLKTADPNVLIVNMYSLKVDSAVSLLSTCKGLLLTGGEDVDPLRYGKQNELSKCEEIDHYRDTLEFALIKKAIANKMPVFGICRGEQILNVALGGSLFTDIPTDKGTAVTHRCPAGSKECLHTVTIIPGTLIREITQQTGGVVNSYHHQAVDRIAQGMKVTAKSENDVNEAIESDHTLYSSFIMGVQWHPERLTQNPLLSQPLGVYFLKEVKAYELKK